MKIVVRIEQTTTDLSAETDGVARYEIAMMTRASTDVRLTNLAYLAHREGKDYYALAFVRRSSATGQKVADRDRSIELAKTCIAAATLRVKKKQEAEALTKYLSCRTFVAQAVEADAVVSAIARSQALSDKQAARLMLLSTAIDESISALLKRPVSSVEDAIQTLAIQLSGQGLNKGTRVTVSPLTYGTTRFSSIFGRTAAVELEDALAQTKSTPKTISGPVVILGTYAERGDSVRLAVTARQVKDGRVVAAAGARILTTKIPSSMPLKPQNFDQALLDSKLLAEGERVSGSLRVEIWTNKGDRNLVYAEGEEMKIYLRVNQPAWVRLFYLLANKAKVPLEQGYFIDASKVNRAIEYPDTFEVSPPFGVEQIFAVAYTVKPRPINTKSIQVGGEAYEVVDDKALVRHRGLRRKKKGAQVSEARLTLTTTPR